MLFTAYTKEEIIMKTKMIRRIVGAIGVACCSVCLLATPVASVPVQAAAPGGSVAVEPNHAVKEWYFKKENGKLYKRLWCYTTGQWETDWIYVRDL